MDTDIRQFFSTFIVSESVSFGARQCTFLTSQGAQSCEVHNVLLNLFLGARSFVYHKTLYFSSSGGHT